jgi:hypothetical protein
MSAVFGVYFRSDRTPSHARWQGAIDGAGFRVALMPTIVAEHTGMLPVKAGGIEYDSGFQFTIKSIFTGMDRLDALLRGESPAPVRADSVLAGLDRFAHFRCTAYEWPAAVCAAAGFARASGGVFMDPYGNLITNIDEIIEYALRESQEPD